MKGMGTIKRIGYAVGRAIGGVLKLANLITGVPAGESTQQRRDEGDRDQRRR